MMTSLRQDHVTLNKLYKSLSASVIYAEFGQQDR